jgi:hypothetical protein
MHHSCPLTLILKKTANRVNYKGIQMPLVEKFTIETTPGIEPISFSEWLDQLPPGEKDRYYTASARNDAHRNEAIAAGLMIVVPGTSEYTWRDDAAKAQGKTNDLECMEFYDRFNADTGRKLVTTIEHVD